MKTISIHADYRLALHEIKQRIQAAQMRAVLAANNELLSLYWYIGQKIVALQQTQGWGSAVVEQMAVDLQAEHPGIQGFSRTSLFAMRQFYLFFSPRFEVVPQPVGQLPWGHIRTILGKVKEVDIVLFYAMACVENGWSRSMRDVNKPIGVSSFITKEIPMDIQAQLPTVAEIEAQLGVKC